MTAACVLLVLGLFLTLFFWRLARHRREDREIEIGRQRLKAARRQWRKDQVSLQLRMLGFLFLFLGAFMLFVAWQTGNGWKGPLWAGAMSMEFILAVLACFGLALLLELFFLWAAAKRKEKGKPVDILARWGPGASPVNVLGMMALLLAAIGSTLLTLKL